MTSQLLAIVAGSRSPGRCRSCGRAVVWVVTAPKGKNLPIDPDRFFVFHTQRNEETSVTFELIGRDQVHFAHCPSRPRRGPAASA